MALIAVRFYGRARGPGGPERSATRDVGEGAPPDGEVPTAPAIDRPRMRKPYAKFTNIVRRFVALAVAVLQS